MPHFSHLRYKGEKYEKCCCDIDECKGKDIFYHNFKEEDGKTINLGSRNNGIYLMNNCFPCTEIIFRKNKIIYELYDQILCQNASIINIYNNSDNIDELIIILNLAKIIIEYFEERIHLLYSDEGNNIITPPKKSISLDNLRDINNEETDLRTIISSPNLLNMNMNKDYKLKKISLIEDKHNINQTRIEPNTIYFIIALDDQMIDKNYFRKFNKCIVFTKNELKMKDLQKFKIEPENSLNYIVKYEQKKIEYPEKDFSDFIGINLCYNELLKNNLNDNNKSKIKSEILYYFYLIKSYINEEHLKIIFKDKEEEIIKDEFRIIIEYICQEDKNIYKKVKDYFGLFYSGWKITNDIKGKVLSKLFRYYCNLFKYIINKSIIKYKFIDKGKTYSKKLKYRPAPSLSSFSVMQNLGIWKQQKKEEENIFLFKDVEKIFNNENKNFQKFLTCDNFFLCLKNIDNERQKDILEYFEDLSINYYTALKLCVQKSEDNPTLPEMEKIFEQIEKEEMIFGALRFKLMKIMDFEIIKHNIKYIEEIEKILNEFIKIKCLEGELETMFAKLMIYLKEYREKEGKDEKSINNKNKWYEEITNRISELVGNKENSKNDFLKTFECKVEYAYVRYEILTEKGTIKNKNEILKKLENLANKFIETNNIYNEVKTYLLMSELYYYINNKEKSLDYLNFALYISYIHTDNYKNYVINYAKYKKNWKKQINCREEEYINIEKRMKSLYEEHRKKINSNKKYKGSFYI